MPPAWRAPSSYHPPGRVTGTTWCSRRPSAIQIGSPSWAASRWKRPRAGRNSCRWRAPRACVGLRFTFHTEKQQKLLTGGAADWLWPAAAAAGVPLMVHPPHSLPLIDAIAARHPNLRLIIDHLGLIRPKLDHEAFAHLPGLLALAKRPNIAVKASAVTDYSSEPYPFPILHGYLRQVFDAFGPKRIFWGSDISRVRHPYRQMITLFTEELAWLGEDDKAWIMGRGLCEWLNWPVNAYAKASPNM